MEIYNTILLPYQLSHLHQAVEDEVEVDDFLPVLPVSWYVPMAYEQLSQDDRVKEVI